MEKLQKSLIFILVLLVSLSLKAQDTFSDTFSSVSYSNNDGTKNWSTNWIESNDDGSSSSGNIRITGNELRFEDISKSSEQITREADLNGATSATLSFDWQTSGLDGGGTGENLSIQISSDGVSFTTIGTFTDSSSGTFSQDIVSYASSTTTVRFINTSTWTYGDWESGEYVYIDNFLITATLIPTTDTDGDGISDAVDLDDDNDGITDEEEYCTSISTSFLTSADVGERSVVINHTGTDYLRVDFSSMDNSFQLDINGATVHPSVLEFESGALDAGDEYFVFQSDGSFINTPWTANSNGIPRLRLIVNEYGVVQLYGSRNTTSTSLELMEAQGGTPFNLITWVAGNNNTFTLTNQAGPGPEGFTGELFASSICDTDADGVSNHLDLDSDNDGIYDLIESGALDESGVADANNNGIIDGATAGSGSNGLFNNLEDNDTDYAILSYSILDSDTDGNYDAYSLDADGDGCNDVLEAGFTDNNTDGLLGPAPVSIDANGKVTSGSDGYTIPDDNNGNTTYDYREVGTTPSISSQPVDVTTCPGCSTSMSVTTDADQIQWQVFSGGAWNDLTDSGIYSGTTTNTLTISPSPSENNNQYRAKVSNNDYLCGNSISNTAVLTLQVTTVVSNRRITYRVNKN